MNLQTARKIGLRTIAGSFRVDEEADRALAAAIEGHVTRTGGRIYRVSERLGEYGLYRPTAELETLRQTERRLKLNKLRK